MNAAQLSVLMQHVLRYIALRTPLLATRRFVKEYVDNAQPNDPPRNQQSDLPRLFYLSPLPPDQSGIAGYSVGLLPELARHFDIIPVHPSASSDRLSELKLSVKTPWWMLNNAQPQDIVLYHIGNSPYHTWMLGLMQQRPGFVVLHDVYLSHLMYHEVSVNQNYDILVSHLQASEGTQALLALQHEPLNSQKILEFPCARLVIDQARHTFVYSQHAFDLIQQFYGTDVARKVTVLNMPMKIPMPMDMPVTQCSKPHNAPEISQPHFLVCCFGLVQASKCNLEIINAWVSLGWHTHADKKLVFVGGCNPDYPYSKQVLAALGNVPGDLKNIELAGWVNNSTYDNYLRTCSLAVQLRTDSRGETSAALLHTLAHGVPTLVNAHGSTAELPADIIHQLPDQFSPAQLQQALLYLHGAPQLLRNMGQRAAEYIRTRHQSARLIDEFAGLLNSSAFPVLKKIKVWVDCSILFLLDAKNKPVQDEYIEIFQKLAAMNHPRLEFRFVRLNAADQVLEPYPQIHLLPEGGLVDVYYHQISQLGQPAALLVDPRMKWISQAAIRKVKRKGARVFYFKPNALNAAVRLCDQLLK